MIQNNFELRVAFLGSSRAFTKQAKVESKIDLHILMAVRDIEEMISSEYQQRVKRHGDSMPFEQFIRARKFVSSHRTNSENNRANVKLKDIKYRH